LDSIVAGTAVLANVGSAIVDVGFAAISRVAGQARAKVAVHSIATSSAVGARVGSALVDVGFAARALKSEPNLETKKESRKGGEKREKGAIPE
jgi:hypothetical protein